VSEKTVGLLGVELLDDKGEAVAAQIQLTYTEDSFLGTQPNRDEVECVIYDDLVGVIGLGQKGI